MKNIIERSKGTVRFGFKVTKKELEANKNTENLIYLFFSFGEGKRFKYSTGYKISYNNWDASKQSVKNKVGILNKDKINSYLKDLEAFIVSEYSKLTLKEKSITTADLKQALDVYTKKRTAIKSKSELSFFEVIERLLNEKKGLVTDTTLRSYKQAKKRLEEYQSQTRTALDFDTIDMTFYSSFNSFLEKQNYSLNTIGKHIKTIKTFFNYALNEGYTTNQKFKNKSFVSKKEITTEIYLTEEEIQKMYKHDFSKHPQLELVRDIFLIGCYTGQRVSDYNGLKKEDIEIIDKQKYFKIKQQKNRKNGKIVYCPITKEIQSIMSKRHNGLPPKKIPEQDINDLIKEVGQELGFNEDVKCEYTKGGVLHTEFIPKYKLIKSHTARRSFCTNKYKAGMSVFDIMLFSGHTTEKEFYKYIRIKDEQRVSHILKSGFFNV